MAKSNIAAGLLMCRKLPGVDLEFFLVHPGGPFFAKKDDGVWSIPKGIPEGNEELLITAQREFFEETGISPRPPFFSLGVVRQKGGKIIHAWTFLGDWNPAHGIVCNTFKMEWPPRSHKYIDIPEVDRAAWMTFNKACIAINPAQIPLLKKAMEIYAGTTAVL